MGREQLKKEMFQKEKRLNLLLREFAGGVVAFSGGVDSTFLAFKAKQAWGPEKVLAVTAVSGLQAEGEIPGVREIADFLGIKHLLVPFEILSREEFVRNTPRRCYYCKCELFMRLRKIAAEYKLPAVMEGSNRDDAGEYRPGLIAARKYGIGSPLMEAGLIKEEIRQLSRSRGLPTWDRIASPCLATRFPYGERLDPERLGLVSRAERYLKQAGFRGDLRVRCHGMMARIEVPVKDQGAVLDRREEIVVSLKRLGFEYVTLDLQGFQSGGFDWVKT